MLLDRLKHASKSTAAYAALRDFIFDYYWDLNDVELECEELEHVFVIFRAYFEPEPSIPDALGLVRMHNAWLALSGEFNREAAIAGMEYDRIPALLEKERQKLISEEVLRQQIEKMYPIEYDWRRVLWIYDGLKDRFMSALCQAEE